MCKDLERVQTELAKADPCFENVPIDESEDSSDLCAAHAQRIISKAICEYIWIPFGSEVTVLQPKLRDLLVQLSEEIEQSNPGGRTPGVWTALTGRALKSLQADSATSQVSETTEHPRPANSTRVSSIISKVFALSPLVDPSQVDSLRMDLATLVKSAVDVWDKCQASGSKISVSLLLDRAQREHWRSQKFDPICSGDEVDSKTLLRIFCLFPQVLARGVRDVPSHNSGLPGSWPTDSDLVTIHPGKGLPEWSSLVVRGRVDQEERKDLLRKAVENAKKELRNTRRPSGYGRRGSKGSVASVSSSGVLKKGGAIDLPEK
jgi:hypothetical protein